MDTAPYMKREVDEKFQDIKDALGRIETQTTLTNGRVSSQERWRAYMTGGMTVLTIIVVPLLAWAMWVLANIQGQVNSAVDQALASYEITETK